MDDRRLSLRLRGAWLRSPYSRKVLAERFGVDALTLSAWMTGHRYPDPAQLAQIEDFVLLYPRELPVCRKRSFLKS